MKKYYCDLHIHSCLSPCADNDMTPYNIAGMAALNGLDVIALTDHNSCGNCEAFFNACALYGTIPVPGAEITTAEDIHISALFETLEAAKAFDEELDFYKPKTENRPEIFGDQLYTGLNDEPRGTEKRLLIAATSLDLESAVKLVRKHGGVAYPAHIDREANGIISILGTIPPEPEFTCAEFREEKNIAEYSRKHKILEKMSFVCGSDAHHLWDIAEASFFEELECEPNSEDSVRKELLKKLRAET